MTKKKQPGFDPEYIRALSIEVYKKRLGKRDTERVLNNPEKGMDYISKSSVFYDPTTIATLQAINERHSLELGILHKEEGTE